MKSITSETFDHIQYAYLLQLIHTKYFSDLTESRKFWTCAPLQSEAICPSRFACLRNLAYVIVIFNQRSNKWHISRLGGF